MFDLPKQVNFLLNKLNSAGYEAYIVGGCVRDMLLGKTPNDFDITTSAEPEQIIEVFKEHKLLTVGLKHGTVTVILDKIPYEITTYRIDKDYSDNRHPDTVEFTKNLIDDLARRDFTINAMAYNPQSKVVDAFYGQKDLEACIIRTVGDPQLRFNEDALRILRALRFASTLGFEIDKKTAESIIENHHLLANISKERITEEIKKLILGENAQTIFKRFSKVFVSLMPPYNPTEKHFVLGGCPKDISIRLAVLFDFKEDMVTSLNHLCFNKATVKKALSLVENKRRKINPEKPDIKQALREFGKDFVLDLLELQKSIGLYTDVEYMKLYNLVQQILSSNECYNLDMLDINGDDLIDLGVTKGLAVGKTLNFILDEVINQKVENHKATIIQYLKENCL
jgi:tRNA nucleotidyltransferase (CCA-adding enzyme)